MIDENTIFIDANAIIYALDKTNELYEHAVKIIQKLQEKEAIICTSHHVIEEVLHIVQRIPHIDSTLSDTVEEIAKIPNLLLIEPGANLDFAKRFAVLSQNFYLEVNDALILQLILDTNITKLFSYDQKLIKSAAKLNISNIMLE